LYTLCSPVTGSFQAGACCLPPTPSSTEVKERIELYLYSASLLSWQVLRRTLPFHYLYAFAHDCASHPAYFKLHSFITLITLRELYNFKQILHPYKRKRWDNEAIRIQPRHVYMACCVRIFIWLSYFVNLCVCIYIYIYIYISFSPALKIKVNGFQDKLIICQCTLRVYIYIYIYIYIHTQWWKTVNYCAQWECCKSYLKKNS